VASIGLLVGLLREQSRQRAPRRLVDRIDQGVAALESLLKGLLDLSRLDAGTVQPRVGRVELQAVFDAIASHEAAAAEARGIRLRCRPTALAVVSDAVLLEQMLRNLVNNAVRCTAHGGVLVGARRRGRPRAGAGLGHRPREFRGGGLGLGRGVGDGDEGVVGRGGSRGGGGGGGCGARGGGGGELFPFHMEMKWTSLFSESNRRSIPVHKFIRKFLRKSLFVDEHGLCLVAGKVTFSKTVYVPHPVHVLKLRPCLDRN